MSDELNGRPSTNFWIIGGAALVWNLIGILFYVSEVTATPEAMAESYSQAQIDFLISKPVWATTAFAIAVNAGAFGSLFLLLRKEWAVPMFALSLAAVLVQNAHAFGLANGFEVWGTNGLILPAVVVVIAVALLLYSQSTRKGGWIS
jgi:hypothetical protein